ncbi:MAG: hypothetical protein ABIH38_03230 [Patescibacteria group bacterium]
MKGVEINKLVKVMENEKGMTFQFENRPSDKILFAKRKVGTVSGVHYHTGKSNMKNPEILVFLSGKIEIYFKDLKTSEEMRAVVDYPVMIKISPNIYHEVKALTDIIFLDMNSLEEGEKDTIKGLPNI